VVTLYVSLGRLSSNRRHQHHAGGRLRHRQAFPER
jgi:hypothetical protein